MTQNMHPLRQRLDQLAADLTAFAVANGTTSRAWSGRKTGRTIGVSLGLVRGLINHHHSLGNGANRQMTSMSKAEEKPMAISTPHSTETKTEAGDSDQVAAQSNPAAPMTQTPKGRAFLRTTVLNVAVILLMLVLSLTTTQSWMQEYSPTAIAVIVLIISIQLLIGISLFL